MIYTNIELAPEQSIPRLQWSIQILDRRVYKADLIYNDLYEYWKGAYTKQTPSTIIYINIGKARIHCYFLCQNRRRRRRRFYSWTLFFGSSCYICSEVNTLTTLLYPSDRHVKHSAPFGSTLQRMLSLTDRSLAFTPIQSYLHNTTYVSFFTTACTIYRFYIIGTIDI